MMNLLAGILSNFSFPVILIAGPVMAAAGLIPLAWHVLWCIEKAAEGWQSLALLVAGLAIPPLGWAHGMSLLLGFGGWL